MRGRCGVAIHSLLGENSVLARHSVGEVLQRGWRYLTDADYRWQIEAAHGRYDDMPDEVYLRLKWRHTMGYDLDLEHPRTFNEKLQWLKLFDRRSIYTQMVDKYRVREFVAQKIGAEHLIPSLGVWDSPDEIDFAALPEQFVLKCNHNSGTGMCVCTDKSQLDTARVKAELRRGLSENYYLHGREWPYKDVPRKIVGEKFMVDESGTELKDYKIFCFDGEPRMIQVDYDRFCGHKRNLYTLDWQYIPAEIEYPTDPEHVIPRPKPLEEMLDLARTVSAGFPHVRTDFYVIGRQIYFGELTFYHGSGHEHMRPAELGLRMGDWLTLPDPTGVVVASTGGRQCSFCGVSFHSWSYTGYGNTAAYGADAREAA